MKDINKLHNESMDCAEQAILYRIRGDCEAAEKLFKKSLQLEKKAIDELDKLEYIEPSYSILHYSGATLALDCNDIRTAEQFISKALSRDPPTPIADDLRNLLEQVNFRRHLHLQGVSLSDDELQMSLAGRAVGFGVIHSNELIQRVEYTTKLIYRIIERRFNKPFREKGQLSPQIKKNYGFFISVPRGGSFAVTLKLGHPNNQTQLPGLTDKNEIVDEFMTLIDFINNNNFFEIETRIPDLTYRNNFIQLVKCLAPDGENVNFVGFTYLHDGKEKYIELTRKKSEIGIPIQKISEDEEEVTVQGTLLYADGTHKNNNEIKIVNEENKLFNVKVPEGLMNDIVKPLWDKSVTIKGRKKGKYIYLEDIEEL